jgi:phosphatidylglycerophosphatase C
MRAYRTLRGTGKIVSPRNGDPNEIVDRLSFDKHKRGLAAFDFDGTLTTQHTMLPFLLRTHGWFRVARTMLTSIVRAHSRDQLKVATVGALFKGMPAARFAELGELYSARLVDLLRPEVLKRLRWHQEQGHATVIVSASMGVYLRPLAQRLGIDGALGVELTADPDGVLNGQVDRGVNNRRQEKVTRLKAWIADQFGPAADFELWAYGDDSGDRELLLIADHPVWVRF